MKILKGFKHKQCFVLWTCLKYVAKFRKLKENDIQFINQQKVANKKKENWTTVEINFPYKRYPIV